MTRSASNPDRPPWGHLAKEIDKEEAQVLMTLGQQVHWWYAFAFTNRLKGLDIIDLEHLWHLCRLRELDVVFYVPKGLSETGES